MPTILFTHPGDVLTNYFTEEALEAVRCMATVRLNESGKPYGTTELIDAAAGCDILITNPQLNADEAFFDQASDIVAFMRCGVDIGNVAVDAASRNGILVTQVHPHFVPAVAELILGAMIDLARNITASATFYRQEKRQPPVIIGRQLFGSTMGVIGYGVIGRYVCELGLAFGMRVLVSDPNVGYTRPGIEQVDFTTLLGLSDFVVCMPKASEDTRDLMNDDAFAAMKRSAYFVSASRGIIVDEGALARALDCGLIAGAALDVGRQHGNLPSPELASRSDVVATPHVGGRTPESIAGPANETVEQLAVLLKGDAPRGSVNVEQATRLDRLRP